MKNKFLKKLFAFIIFLTILFTTILEKNVSYAASNNYYIKVNYEANVVTIYEKNGNNLTPIKAMICSCGTATPKGGIYKLNYKYRWLALFGGVYGQYCSRIVGNILFHSVPYTRNGDPSSLEFWEYDKLGTSASAGCIRLKIEDAKWIYDNCLGGTEVEFYASSDPGPLGKPSAIHLTDLFENLRGWDPTDPASNNPWNSFRDIAFDSKFYADNNPDLKTAFGYDENNLKIHWYNSGIKEGRQASCNFDVRYYLENNQDLKDVFGNNFMSAYKHYLSGGYNEDRPTTKDFNISIYKVFNKDLQGMNNYDLIQHYKNFGHRENRIAEIDADKKLVVFDYNEYANLNSDLKQAFGNNKEALYKHWITNGIKEGRQASSIFNVKYYLANNSDLKASFGNDYVLAYKHFLETGINEERKISEDFDIDFYRVYEDLKNLSNSEAIYHYAIFGKNEGRLGNISKQIEEIIFDSGVYANKNQDLKKAFGNNKELLKKHFYKNGISEGRISSEVFCIRDYIENNKDLKQAFSTDYKAALFHFINTGIKEDRKTSEDFDIRVYKEYNEDLCNAFGENNTEYYTHYIKYGKTEGRKCI